MSLALDLHRDLLADDWTGAPCTGRSAEWDVEALPEKKLAARARARELCAPCPHIRACARRALAYDITGMVCAGVVVPRASRARSDRGIALTQLARIAGIT